MLSVDQIATRLDNRFRLLVGGGRTAPARQQTLRATLDWSYELLGESEQRLLNRLSVFAGGWTLEAAEHVAADSAPRPEEVFEVLARLVDRSLVQAEPGPAGDVRYRLLESVRAYASEQLHASDDGATVQRRHCAYYSTLAEAAEAHVLWGANGLDWLVRVDRERDNLRAALGWSLSAERRPAGWSPPGRAPGALLVYARRPRRGTHVADARAGTRRVPTDESDAEDTRAWAWAWYGPAAWPTVGAPTSRRKARCGRRCAPSSNWTTSAALAGACTSWATSPAHGRSFRKPPSFWKPPSPRSAGCTTR